MNKKERKTIALLLCAVLLLPMLFACAGQPAASTTPSAGESAPASSPEQTEGGTITVTDHAGRQVSCPRKSTALSWRISIPWRRF